MFPVPLILVNKATCDVVVEITFNKKLVVGSILKRFNIKSTSLAITNVSTYSQPPPAKQLYLSALK